MSVKYTINPEQIGKVKESIHIVLNSLSIFDELLDIVDNAFNPDQPVEEKYTLSQISLTDIPGIGSARSRNLEEKLGVSTICDLSLADSRDIARALEVPQRKAIDFIRDTKDIIINTPFDKDVDPSSNLESIEKMSDHTINMLNITGISKVYQLTSFESPEDLRIHMLKYYDEMILRNKPLFLWIEQARDHYISTVQNSDEDYDDNEIYDGSYCLEMDIEGIKFGEFPECRADMCLLFERCEEKHLVDIDLGQYPEETKELLIEMAKERKEQISTILKGLPPVKQVKLA